MKRVREEGASSAGNMPQLYDYGLSDVPSEVMPRIWSRLPEESLAALLCTARYFSCLEEAKKARVWERKFELTTRCIIPPRRSALCPQVGDPAFDKTQKGHVDLALDLLMHIPRKDDWNDFAAGLQRLLARIAQPSVMHAWQALQPLICRLPQLEETPRKLLVKGMLDFGLIQSLANAMSKAPFLDKRINDETSCLRDRKAFTEGLLILHENVEFISVDDEEQLERLFEEVKRLLPETGSLAMLKLDDARIRSMMELLKSRDEEELKAELPRLMLWGSRGNSKLQEACLALCETLAPAVQIEIYSEAVDALGKHPWLASGNMRSRIAPHEELPPFIAATIRSLLELKGEALVQATRTLLRQFPVMLLEPGPAALQLVSHLHACAGGARASLMVESLFIFAYGAHPQDSSGQRFRLADGTEADAENVRSMLLLCRQLPAAEIKGNVLASLACLLAYLPAGPLQTETLLWLTGIMDSQSTTERLPTLIVLAHLHPLFTDEIEKRLRTLLDRTVQALPEAEGKMLLYAMQGAMRLAEFCAPRETLKTLYLDLLFYRFRDPHADLMNEALRNIVDENLHDALAASLVAQMNALPEWLYKQSACVIAGMLKKPYSDRHKPQFTSEEDSSVRYGAFNEKHGKKLVTQLFRHARSLSPQSLGLMILKFCYQDFDNAYEPQIVEALLHLPDCRADEVQAFIEANEERPNPKFEALHKLAVALGRDAGTAMIEEFKSDIPDDAQFVRKLSAHWKPMLHTLMPSERYSILHAIACTADPVEDPMSSDDVQFIDEMIDMASMLRDGDKVEFLRELIQKLSIIFCNEGKRLRDRLDQTVARLPIELQGDITAMFAWKDALRIDDEIGGRLCKSQEGKEQVLALLKTAEVDRQVAAKLTTLLENGTDDFFLDANPWYRLLSTQQLRTLRDLADQISKKQEMDASSFNMMIPLASAPEPAAADEKSESSSALEVDAFFAGCGDGPQ